MFNLLKNYSYYDDYSYYYRDMLYDTDSAAVGLAFIVALVVSIIVYFTFLSKRNEGRFTGFTGWLYEVLSFGKLIIEALLKICYMFITIFISIISIVHMKYSFIEGLLLLIVLNLLIRVGYECLLMIVMICKNIKEINSKLKDPKNDNNLMNGGRSSYNMPPQQPYGQSTHGRQQSYAQPTMNHKPMGMQQPAGMQQPMGMQQPASMQQSMGNQYQGSNGPMGSIDQPVDQNQARPQDTSKQEELPKVQNVKYCLKCGCVVEHNDVFCPNCGTKVVE